MSRTRTLAGVCCVIFAFLVMQTVVVAPAEGQQYTDIYRLGNPATTFSPHSPKDLEELKDLFDRFEKDLRVALDKGGWGGNADDLFNAVRGAKEGDGTITKTTVRPGDSFKWMAYRKGGQPSVIENPRWSAKNPIDAWKIVFRSGDNEYTFVVPISCMNLAYHSSRRVAEDLSCSVSATYDQASDTVSIKATGNGEVEVTAVGVPGGRDSLGDLKSTGPNTWTFTPEADGMYNISAEVSKGGKTATCTGSVRVGKAKPVCDIDVTVDATTLMITVDSTSSQGDFELTGLTLPDGSAGDLAALTDSGSGRWGYDPSESLSKKPGNYTYTFAGTSTLHGTETGCESAAIVGVPEPDYKWIVRGFYAPIWSGTNDFADDGPIAAPSSSAQAVRQDEPIFTQFSLEEGDGLGINAEYLLKPAIGIYIEAIFGDAEGDLMWDQGDLWLMAEKDIDINFFNLGFNYHFTPASRVDFYAGALLGLAQIDDVEYRFEETTHTTRADFDDEFSFGLAAGIDVPFKAGGPWIFTAGLRYQIIQLSGKADIGSVDFDPFTGSIGIGYRF